MKKNLERPGLGFPSSSKKTTPQTSQASKTAPSLFGLISQVNKGVTEIKKPEEKSEDSAAVEAAKIAAKAVAEKLAIQNSIRKQIHIQDKKNQFLAAKANVERLFQGGNLSTAQTQKTEAAVSNASNIFKVPEAKRSEKATSSSERPGLGFDDGKKSYPKAVGLGRNVFSKADLEKSEGKYSLVPYGYDDREQNDKKDDSEGRSRSRKSGSSSSREGRRFTEEGKDQGKKGSSRVKRNKSEKHKDDGGNEETLQDDYFRYGFGKEENKSGAGIPSTYGDPGIKPPVLDRNDEALMYQERVDYGGNFVDRQYDDGMEDRNPDNIDYYDERNNGQYGDGYPNQEFVGQIAVGMDPSSMDFGGAPGQPVFFQAVPLNVVPLPLQPVNFDGQGNEYYDDGGQYPDEGYPQRDNYDDGYDRGDRDDDYYDEKYNDDGNYGQNWSGTRPGSLSPSRYPSGEAWDDSRDRRQGSLGRGRSGSPGKSRQKRSLDRESGWSKIDPQDRKRLEQFEKKMGYSHRSRSRSRERYKHGDRGGSLDRERHRGRRSRSRGRSRDGRGRRSSGGKSPKSSQAAEDPFVLGHRAFMEEREQKWEALKAQNQNLTNVDKAMHPLFINTHRGGYLCKDCSFSCMDSGEYGMHLLTENHLRVIQLKAQVVLLQEKSGGTGIGQGTEVGKSGFDNSDRSRGHSSRRDRSRDRYRSRDRSRSRGRRSRDRNRHRTRSRERRDRSRERYRDRRREKSRDRGSGPDKKRDKKAGPDKNQVSQSVPASRQDPNQGQLENLEESNEGDSYLGTPGKPKGPLLVSDIRPHCVRLSWGKKQKLNNVTYHVEFCRFAHDKASEWNEIGTTRAKTYLVENLDEDSLYKFRVKAERGGYESGYVFSSRIRTLSSDPAVRKKRAKVKHMASYLSNMSATEKAQFFQEKRAREKTQACQITIDLTGDEPSEEHKRMIEQKRKEAERLRAECHEEEKKRDREMMERMVADWVASAKVVFFERLENFTGDLGPILGLEYMTEIQYFNPNRAPQYRCKLCIASLADTAVLSHIRGLPHKLKYFERHNPEIYDQLKLLTGKSQKKLMANKHGEAIEREKGWVGMNLVRMENPADHNGRVIFTDPVLIPAPEFKPPEVESTIEDINKEVDALLGDQDTVHYTTDGEVIHHFDKLLQDAEVQRIKTGEKIEPVLGLQFVKELLHPEMNELPRYQCNLCKSNCSQTNILPHIWGRKHRLNYLKQNHPDMYNNIMTITNKKEMNDAIDVYSQEIEESIGRGTMDTLKARSKRLWDWAKTVAEKAAQSKGVQEPNKAAEAAKTEVIKFGVKAKEQPVINVQPTNVLETGPSKKEEKDWETENAMVKERVNNGSIIKSTRPPKFNTVYSAFFQKFPIVGIQWVTEFQKPDKNDEPWYLCYLCQCKIPWKSILDHLTSVNHRTNYLKKTYSNMYNLLMRTTGGNPTVLKKKLEEYSAKILNTEQEYKMDVMLELPFTKPLVVAAKEQEKAVREKPTAGGRKPEKKSAALETAFSSGFSVMADDQSDNRSDSGTGQRTLKGAPNKIQLETRTPVQLVEKPPFQQKPQSGPPLKLNEPPRVANIPIQPQFQTQPGPIVPNMQPVQSVSVPVVAHTRGFSSQQILPGQPIPRQLIAPASMNVPQPLMPPNTGMVSNAPFLPNTGMVSNAPILPNAGMVSHAPIPPTGLVSSVPVPYQQIMPPLVSGPAPVPQSHPGLPPPHQGGPQQLVLSRLGVSSAPQGIPGPLPLQGPINMQPMPTMLSTASQPFGVPTSMPMSQPQFGLQQQNIGIQQPNIGIQQPNIGIQQPNIGIQPSIGVTQPNIGVPQQPRIPVQPVSMGMQQPSVELPQPEMGLQQPRTLVQPFNMGMPQNTTVSQPDTEVQQINIGVQQTSADQQSKTGIDVRPEIRPGIDVRPVRPEIRPGIDVRPVRPEIRPGIDVRPEIRPGIDVRPVRPGMQPGIRPRLNQPRARMPGPNQPRFSQPANITERPRHDWSKYKWNKDDEQKGGSKSNEIATSMSESDNTQKDSRMDSRKTESEPDRERDEHRDKISSFHSQNQGKFDSREHEKGEKRKDFRNRSPEYQKRPRRSFSPDRQSPGYRDRRMGNRNSADRWRSDERGRTVSSERDVSYIDRPHYDASEPIPEEGERVVRLLSPRSRRDIDRSETERYNRQVDRGEYEDNRHIDREEYERYDRQNYYDRYGEHSEHEDRYRDRSREDYRRSRSPHYRRHYDERRAHSPYERRHHDDRRSEEYYRAGSRDRYSDHGRDTYLDEAEASGRSGPDTEDIQTLLAQVSSRMQMMSEEDRQQLEEELKRNLPQAFSSDETVHHDRTGSHGSGRGGAGSRGRGFRGGRPPRGRGFQRGR